MQELLKQLNWIIVNDETWMRDFELELKLQSNV